jgi:hypothetical protein
MTPVKGVALAFAATALVMVPNSAAAEDGINGAQVRAMAFEHIPIGALLALEPADDSELTFQVAQLVETGLQTAGYRLHEESHLVLTVATEMTDGGAEAPWPVDVDASKGSLRMRLYLFGRNSSGVLQESPRADAGEYRILLSIHDRRMRTRGYLWRGTASTCRCGQGAVAASRSLVPELVAAIGRTTGEDSVQSAASR